MYSQFTVHGQKNIKLIINIDCNGSNDGRNMSNTQKEMS